jgi:FG-GAP-like repeat
MEDRTLLSTFIVNNTDDGGPGSLRQAIVDSNNAVGATNTIDFDIPGTGVRTIFPLSALPVISTSVLIDGTSQPGYAGTPLIELNGSQNGANNSGVQDIIDGLTISAASVTVRGLDIDSFNQGGGIHLTGTGATGDWIYGNLLGTDPTGAQTDEPNAYGIEIDSGASDNLIGTDGDGVNDMSERNLIRGNLYNGVLIDGQGTNGNVVAGNEISSNATGTSFAPNSIAGVYIEYGSSDNTIGGATAIAGNLITTNGGPGVVVGYTLSDTSVGNEITANRIFANTGQAIDLGDDGVTDNGNTPGQGPNNLQNFPIIFMPVAGQLQGRLGGSSPDTTFRVDFFASAGYGPGGSGEAEDYLGSMEVTTDSQGQATFTVPFTAPAGLPIITATATDPQGNTSEVSALRQTTLQAPTLSIRNAANQSLAFATNPGDGIAVQDSDAWPITPSWDLTLAVSDGTLTLSSTAGITGSGDGTASLSYSGPLSAIDTALQGMIFNPAAGSRGDTTLLTLGAQSYGASPLQTQFVITDGVVVVDTTADSGPGSLRQAILDTNSEAGLALTIDFAIPGAGVQTIEPITPLPPITASVLIDGTTQPGFAGTPLVALGGQSPGSAGQLAVSSGNVTVRGLALGGVTIDASEDERLIAVVTAPGGTSRLSLLDQRGNVLVQNEGVSFANPDHVIDEDLTAGDYSLAVDSNGGQGSSAWTIMLTPATAPFLPIPVGAPGSSAGTSVSSIVAGEFTGDGHVDLAVSDSEGVQILLGNGDGTFQPARTVAAGIEGPLVAGDFNGDGHLDLAVANSSSDTISVLLGNGDGAFQNQVTYAVGSAPLAIVAGDFTGDGHLDLAVTDSDGVQILLGNGDGTFRPPVTYAATLYPTSIVAGDFTGDGHLDLAVAGNVDSVTGNYVVYVSVLLGNGDGTFRPPVTCVVASAQPGFLVSGMVAGDFNGDGHLDLAVSDSGDTQAGVGEVSVLLGNGDGTFQPARTVAVGIIGALVAGDFTGNGHLDLAAANYEYDDVSVLLGNGDGTFQPQVTYAPGAIQTGFLVGGIVAGDFTGNGRTDLAASVSDNVVSVYLGHGDGTFQPLFPASNAVGAEPGYIVAGKFTGNGKLDLVVTDADGVQILLGNGDGTFQPARTVAVGIEGDPVVGDFNGDGRLDLAVGNSNNGVSVLLGNGDGTFQPAVSYLVGGEPQALVTGDFNGDGRIDLAVAVITENPVTNTFGGDVSVLLGNGDGTFQPAVQYALSGSPYAIAPGDFRGDGRLDLAAAVINSYDQNPVTGTFPSDVSVLLGNGDGTFQPAIQYPVGSSAVAIVAGDFNDDGHLDLATANSQDNTISVLLGNGDGTFQPQVTYPTGLGPAGIVAGDFNGDGKLDLATANSTYAPCCADENVSVLLGNGNGTFQPQVSYATGTYTFGIVAGDLIGEGKLDLAVVDGGSNDVSVLLGTGEGTFVDPGQFVTAPHATPLVADVNGDGSGDVLVVDGSGNILFRQAIPGQSGTFEPPVTVNPGYPSRDIAWVPNTLDGPLLASVDAQDDAVSLYAYRNGGFLRIGSLTTGQLPAQIIAADLTGDGVDDLVVRNAGDGSLSVFFTKTVIGPINPAAARIDVPTFLPPMTLPIGLGISDVEAVDTTGSGSLDLMVTNKLTGQVSALYNLGNGTFAPPVPYRAGTGLSEIDPGSTPEVTSLEATAGVAAGRITPGGPTSLVTINPGSYTLDVLAGLGEGRFANPVSIQTPSPAQIVRMGDFTGNGLDDLAVLTTDGVSIYLANSQGGFLPPTTYAVPSESDGLTIADLTGNGKLDLLVGDAYGDVLVLLGQGDGTFQPYHEANQSVELAVADLNGNGSKDVIYADQGLDRVVVDYGASSSTVLANQSTGLLDPGAVKLADLNGDGIPDLIVANSGSNNVLIYPGLSGKLLGQFGPAINDGNGYFVGTNPVGITVANLTGALPDLVVADKGSDQVSILLNQSQQGGAISFSAGPRLNSGGSGPVSTVVGDFTGGAFPDLLVTNSQSNDVVLLPGLGQGFFNDQNPRTYAVGANPGSTFIGNFDGQTDLVTVNAGSNDLTLISGFEGSAPTTGTIASGGVDPDTAFAFASTSGFEDLVVGNAGDGTLALFEGGADSLGLTASASEPNLPDPTALAFSALTGGEVQFYAATAGHESAELVALSLGIESAATSSSNAATFAGSVAQLVSLTDSSLPLLASVLTFTITVSGDELNLEMQETDATAVAAFLSGTGATVGQSLTSQSKGGPAGDNSAESDEPGTNAAGPVPAVIAPWARFVLGLDQAIEQFQRENPNGVSGAPAGGSGTDHADPPPAADPPAQRGPTTIKASPDQVPESDEPDRTENASPSFGVEAIDAIIQSFWDEGRAADSQERLSYLVRPSDGLDDGPFPIRLPDWPRPQSLSLDRIIREPRVAYQPVRSSVGVDRRISAIRVKVLGRDKAEPAPALAFLVVATMAHEWVDPRRWHRAIRLGRPGAPPDSGKRGNPSVRRPQVLSGAQ